MHGSTTSGIETRALCDLARAWGVETEYFDLAGMRREASADALLAVLRALGAPIDAPDDAEDALREREAALAGRLVDPVTIAWEGRLPVIGMGVAAVDDRRIECRLTLEDGETREWVARSAPVVLPWTLPFGYHDLTLAADGRSATTRILSAPVSAHEPEGRGWGLFLPLYALRSRRSAGIGDLADLGQLLEWTAGLGGRTVATLPLLASFLSKPFDPSPYAPVSRLFWNELYVDVESAPEYAESESARRLFESADMRARLRELRRAPLVDYRAAAEAKREVLSELAETFFAGRAWDSERFQTFLAASPEARDYAAFRAACEARDETWRAWPDRLRGGALRQGDYDPAAARYHLYVQWLAAHQLEVLAETSAAIGAELYFDLPLGVHPDGYDVWRRPDLYAEGISVGAPPDDFFAGGQDWGFPPLHPERQREDGYAYLAAAIRNLCRFAGTLRIDHVMGLHRQFWVPRGAGATDGLYVRYRSEELWAVFAIESRRHRTAIVGEDLGTVPDEVREAMGRHGIARMYVLPFEAREADGRGWFEPVPPRSVASLGTHDLPPFAAWWEELPEARRRAFLDALEAGGALHGTRPADAGPEMRRARRALRGALRWLAESPARLLVVGLEDLWQETEPQNVPGTTMDEEPNWRRKARYAFETFTEIPEVVGPLEEIARIRGGSR